MNHPNPDYNRPLIYPEPDPGFRSPPACVRECRERAAVTMEMVLQSHPDLVRDAQLRQDPDELLKHLSTALKASFAGPGGALELMIEAEMHSPDFGCDYVEKHYPAAICGAAEDVVERWKQVAHLPRLRLVDLMSDEDEPTAA